MCAAGGDHSKTGLPVHAAACHVLEYHAHDGNTTGNESGSEDDAQRPAAKEPRSAPRLPQAPPQPKPAAHFKICIHRDFLDTVATEGRLSHGTVLQALAVAGIKDRVVPVES